MYSRRKSGQPQSTPFAARGSSGRLAETLRGARRTFCMPRALAPLSAALSSLVLAACGRDPGPPASSAATSSERRIDQTRTEPLAPGAVVTASVSAGRPAAVVELYTSQGCSSCPSADSVANAVDTAARAGNQRVYVLAFHVDYWDNIGWPDPYSDAAYTARQREKSRRRGKSGVFTPEAVVQGTDSFVGSDGPHMQGAVAKALGAPVLVSVEALSVNAATGSASWQIGALPVGARIHVALAERGIVTDVRAGENAGKQLAHEGVVRRFHTTTETRGSVALGKLPARGSVVAFVEGQEGAVLGAQAVDFDRGVVADR